MIDTTITKIDIWLKNDMACKVSQPLLPPGFRFETYQGERDQRNWAEILCSVGFLDQNVKTGMQCFQQEFGDRMDLVKQRMFFITTEEGKYVGTCTAWENSGLKRGILHWLGVRPEYQKYGLGKALVQKVLYTFQMERPGWPGYLLTQTTSHKAICLYMKFGFYAVYTDDASKADFERAAQVLDGVMREKDYIAFVNGAKKDG